MSLTLRGDAWYRIKNLVLVTASLLLLFGGTGFGAEAEAQATRLKLLDQVPELGAGAVSEDPLSPGALVAVFTREAGRAYALENLRTGHEDFGREIREGSAATFRLGSEGRTPEEFEQTEASGNVYYVLALTTRGELLGSYVKDDSRGGDYYPGFARVVSGDMVMGPVPEEHRETLKGALRSTVDPEVTDTADGSRAVKDTAEASSSGEEEKQAKSTKGVSSQDRGYLQAFWDAVSFWHIALMLGLLIGGLGVWGVLYKKYTSKISRKDNRIGKLKRDLYNEKKSKNSKKGIAFSSEKKDKMIDKKSKKIRKLENKLDEKKSEIEKLERKIRRLKKRGVDRTSSRQSGEAESIPDQNRYSEALASSDRSSRQESTDRTEDLIGRAFVNWCNEAGAAMVDRHSMFANKLQDSLSGAELQRIFREKNAAGIVFADDVQDAVEYWHVRVDGRDFLLPQPHRSGFREVEECFLVDCTSPSQIQEFEPAELQSSGGEYKLKSEGILA